MKVHEIYDLKIPIPVGWKISKNLSEDPELKSGSVLAVDYSKQLNYPRNIEIKVIPDSVVANSYYTEKITKSLLQKFSASYRGLSDYETVHSEFRYISDVKSILLFSHFRLSGSEMSHLHLILPRSGYYYLITYTDFKARLKSSADESFEVFWSMAEEISVPSQTFFSTVVQQKSAFALMVLATVALIILLGFIVVWLKKLARIQPPPLVLDEISDEEVDSGDRVNQRKPILADQASAQVRAKTSLARQPQPEKSRSAQSTEYRGHPAVSPAGIKDSSQEEDEDILDFKEFFMTQDLGAMGGEGSELEGTLMDQLDFQVSPVDKSDKRSDKKLAQQKKTAS